MRLGLLFGLFAALGCATGPKAEQTQGAVSPVATLAVQHAFVGEGTLEAKTDRGGRSRLALERLGVTARTAGDVAETSVEHVFRNDSEEVLEGTFRFPLPAGAILVGLAMEMNGELVDGELVEREKARKAYEQIVDQMLDPALLEWENGQTFKLRVFPIEPKKTKRVVLRFLAPLHRTPDGLFFAFRPPSVEAHIPLEKVAITVDGHAVRATSAELLVPVGPAPDVVVERTKDAAYFVAHVRPSFGRAAPQAAQKRQALIALCDRSRSMLEARALQTKTLGLLVDKLGADDRFTVVTGDVGTRALGKLRPRADKAAAVAFVDAAEPDGASDLGKLIMAAREPIQEARSAGLEPVVVVLGDGSATWGETRSAALAALAKDALGGTTMHVVLLGRSNDEPAARMLAAAVHGRVLRPKTEPEAERAAASVLAASTQKRLDGVHLVGADDLDVPSTLPSTLYEGDEVMIALRSARDVGSVRLVATTSSGEETSQTVALGTARPAQHVAQRWAKSKIERLEGDGDTKKDEVIRTSLDHGVMSRYTSFLVLESDEAYARFQIERKARVLREAEARVSGDLDGNERAASVSPDHLQPGDPEVHIPAPADASSVVVVFPFGETKNAAFERDEHGHGSWVSRFLVDRRTPDGTYEILVRITHADGRLEILKLPYVVDTQRPNFDVTVVPKRGGFEIRAKQRLSAEEIRALAPDSPGSLAERRERFASVLTDAKRIEVRTPDGQTLSLVHVRLGEFVGTWTPGASVGTGAKLRLVAVDRAMNERVIEVAVP